MGERMSWLNCCHVKPPNQPVPKPRPDPCFPLARVMRGATGCKTGQVSSCLCVRAPFTVLRVKFRPNWRVRSHDGRSEHQAPRAVAVCGGGGCGGLHDWPLAIVRRLVPKQDRPLDCARGELCCGAFSVGLSSFRSDLLSFSSRGTKTWKRDEEIEKETKTRRQDISVSGKRKVESKKQRN